MTGVAVHQGSRAVQVIIGVDTHQDRHVAVAIDRQGVRLSEHHALATTYGYAELERWSRSLGGIRAFGIEGTGSYGAGVARFLTGRGYAVIEVNRPDRAARYRKGKSDSTDAEMGSACGACRSGRRHTQVRRGRSRNDPYAQERQGLGRQGSHPGRQPDEGAGCHGPGRASRSARWSLRRCPSPRGARASVQVVWMVQWRRPGTLFAHLPAATVSSAERSTTWRPSSNDSPGRQRRHWSASSA